MRVRGTRAQTAVWKAVGVMTPREAKDAFNAFDMLLIRGCCVSGGLCGLGGNGVGWWMEWVGGDGVGGWR